MHRPSRRHRYSEPAQSDRRYARRHPQGQEAADVPDTEEIIVRHPEVRAQRASKDAAQALGGRPSRLGAKHRAPRDDAFIHYSAATRCAATPLAFTTTLMASSTRSLA